MSDSFQSYVFGKAIVEDGRADFRRTSAWLLAEEIIGSETADNVLGGLGFVPGARASSILVRDDDGWRHLETNGVAIRAGRIVEASGDWEFSKCPNCGVRLEIDPQSADAEPIYAALDAFHEGRDSWLECSKCGVLTELEYWDFGDAMAVGDAVVSFLNWPMHKDGLSEQLSDISGLKCSLVRGKV